MIRHQVYALLSAGFFGSILGQLLADPSSTLSSTLLTSSWSLCAAIRMELALLVLLSAPRSPHPVQISSTSCEQMFTLTQISLELTTVTLLDSANTWLKHQDFSWVANPYCTSIASLLTPSLLALLWSSLTFSKKADWGTSTLWACWWPPCSPTASWATSSTCTATSPRAFR